MMDEITTRNCQIITIPTKTHNIVLASKKDIPDAERTVKEFLSFFEIVNIFPKVRSGELIKQVTTLSDAQINKSVKKFDATKNRQSSLSMYLQIKDLLPDMFTAIQYYEQIKKFRDIKSASVYAHMDTLIKAGKIKEIDGYQFKTFQKIHLEQENIDTKLKELIGGSAPGRFI